MDTEALGDIPVVFCPPSRKRAEPFPHQPQHGAGDARCEAPGPGAELVPRSGGGGLQQRAGAHEELSAGRGSQAPGLHGKSTACKMFGTPAPSQRLQLHRELESSGMEMLKGSLWGLLVGREELVGGGVR